jgi:hypothetical protein
MIRSISLLAGLVVPAFILAIANPVVAQDKAKTEKGKAVQKVLHDDDKVRVTETAYKPGDVGGNSVRGFRVSRVLSGGTLERTWADGTKEKVERKTGDVSVSGPDKQAYFNRNIGKTDYVIYTVNIKAAKK